MYISYGGRPVQPRATLETAGIQALCTLHIHPKCAAVQLFVQFELWYTALPLSLGSEPWPVCYVHVGACSVLLLCCLQASTHTPAPP